MENLLIVATSILANTYILYRLLKLYFLQQVTSDRFLIVSIFLYQVGLSIIANIILLPVALLCINIVCYILLTYNFKAAFQKRIMFTVTVMITFVLVELLTYYIFYNRSLNLFERDVMFHGEIAIFVSDLLKFFAYQIIKRYKMNFDEEKILPKNSWIYLCVFHLSSLIIAYIFSFYANNSDILITLGLSLLVLINFITIYLFENLSYYYISAEKKKELELRNKYFEQQLLTINASNDSIRSVKHDIINILSLIHTCIDIKDTDRAKNIIKKEVSKINCNKIYTNVGNLEIDSILNFKLNEMSLKGIIYNLDIDLRDEVKTEDADLIVILGNLLDNAIEANDKSVNEKFIDIKISCVNNCMNIRVMNAYNGELIVEEGVLQTKKEDKEYHGFGLKNIKKVVDSYNGTFQLSQEDSMFTANVVLYFDKM